MKYHIILFLLLLTYTGAAAQSPTRTGKDYAVFFYVTDFQPGLKDLPDTQTEARDLAKELTDNYGFACSFVPECTKAQIQNELKTWNQRLKPGDQVLFFFSTHGYYDRDSDRGYLIPSDGHADDQNNYFTSWLSYDDLRTYLAPCKAGHLLVALDACYSGAFGIRSNRKPDDPAYNESVDCAAKIGQAMQYKGRQFITAGKVTEATPGKSAFAAEILKTLRTGFNEDGMVLIDDLAYRLHKLKSPEPEDGTFVGHQPGGDFVFVRKNACATKVATLDRDGDGTPDSDDKCPDEYGPKAKTGCPDKGTASADADADYDGIPDARDGCPNEYGAAKANGCPDRDNDGVPDKSDKCRDLAGEPHWQGCPDTDGDGLPDHEDQCPNQRGLAVDKGCPPPDRDGDGVPDKADKCPDQAGQANMEGCPEKKEEIDAGLFDLVLVKGGTFKMGCIGLNNGCEEDEKPAHQVTLSDFYIGRYEVTQRQWKQVMGGNPSEFENCEDCPVENVSWYDIQQFLKILNEQKPDFDFRLPTEAEWEYAAIGGELSKNLIYSGENNPVEVAWFNKNSSAKTHPVGLKKPNELGIFDMSGNVFECCMDTYDLYDSEPKTNPMGPYLPGNSFNIRRGGAWNSEVSSCRCKDRSNGSRSFSSGSIGFRLARTK